MPFQKEIAQRPTASKIFLEGQAGSGKTTTATARLGYLLENNIPARSILVLVPQRTLAAPYQEFLRAARPASGELISILTIGGLARRMVDLYWPLISEGAGVAKPDSPPSFLTLETSLYYMAHLVRPHLDEGMFDSVTIDRNRLYSQILDNLNKAAIVGFPHTEIHSRLREAWVNDTTQAHIIEDAQKCVNLFREYCLQNNLLDFSLQIEIFRKYLWAHPVCRDFITSNYQHLIYDNIEEDVPIAHDFIREWLPNLRSVLLIYDQDAGYRKFLGADPVSGHSLVDECTEYHIYEESFVSAPALQAFGLQVGMALEKADNTDQPVIHANELNSALRYPEQALRFYPQMLDWTVDRVDKLIRAGTSPREVVLLAPFMPDSLRFALTSRLESRGIPYRSHRPSRSLRDEPITQALLTLASLAHPAWNIQPSKFEVAYALLQIIDGLDLVRSQILVEVAFRRKDGVPALQPISEIRPEMRDRITYTVGNRYEYLRNWLDEYSNQPAMELDFFFARLFGEVLSQLGFSFHNNFQAGIICQNLIESAQKFRWAVGEHTLADGSHDPSIAGREYLTMIQEGILAAQYIQSWQMPEEEAVLIAPAYTFLLSNLPVDYQFWIDAGSSAWSERLFQPLTHPVILSRQWPKGRAWTDIDEYEYNCDALHKLLLGLLRRCRKQVFLGLSKLGESGYESRGLLLRIVHVVMTQARGYQNG